MEKELFPIEVQADSDKIVGRRLCFILNANLKVRQTLKIMPKHHLMAVPYHDEIRTGVVCGIYKETPADFEKVTSDTLAAEMWRGSGSEDNPVLETLIEDPLSILTSMFLAPIQEKMLERVFEIIDVTYKWKPRKAIACAYYDPDEQIQGQILSQDWRIK